MDIASFKVNLKNGNLGGVYLFAGEEDYLVRYYLKTLREKILTDESFAVFNNPVFDGEDIDFSAIIEAVKSPPMMSDFKLIEWRHANFTALREGGLESLEELIAVCKEYPY